MKASTVRVACLAGGMVLLAAPCLADEKHPVTVSYVLAPARPLPEGLKAVAVIDSGVQTRGTQQDERERKWSQIAADLIESMLQQGGQFGSDISVAKRRDTKAILEERDLRLAGLVQGEAAAEAGKLLAVQGLITSNITINLDVRKGTKKTMDWTSLLGGMTGAGRAPAPGYMAPGPAPRVVAPVRPVGPAPRGRARAYVDPRTGRRYRVYEPAPRGYVVRPAPPPPGVVVPVQPEPVAPAPAPMFGTREVEEVSRHLTVQCSFSLIDAVTGKSIVQFSPPPYQKTDKQSPDFLFGTLMDQKELDPVDHFIGELVERATQEFVSMLVPTQVSYTYELVGTHSASEAGIRALRAEDYETAVRQFEKEIAKRPDEHEAIFALGVTYELMGNPRKALELYSRAVSSEDVDEEELAVYTSARRRLADQIDRILKPGPTEPEGLPPAAPAPPQE